MKLLVVISLTLTLSHVVVHLARVRREPKQMSEKEKADCVKRHNVLRAQEGSSDMQLMTWNESLAGAARVLVEGCKFEHAFPPLPGTKLTTYGQNLFMVGGTGINVAGAIQAWYNEKKDHDYDTLSCAAGKACGHYTQVVWSSSNQVGCHYHYCKKKKPLIWNAVVFACDYIPPGNYRGARPFQKGRACSACANGAGWCKDKLCHNNCPAAGKECSCTTICYNCAKLNLSTCRCSCADGWHGRECSVPCKDVDKRCGAGWNPGNCAGSASIRSSCPAMCKLCKPDPDAWVDQCPPVYGPGAHSTSTMFMTVQQLMTIILMIIIAYSSISNNAAL